VHGIIISKPDPPFGLPINQDQWLYFFTLAVALGMFVLGWNLLRRFANPGMFFVFVAEQEV
jgi:branched-chain amino acid transport system permease protein